MDFLTNIYTTQDRDTLLYEVELFKRQDYGDVRSDVLDYLKTSTDLKKIQQDLKSLEVLSVTLATSPTISIVEIISKTLKKILDKQVLLEISVEESLIGGAVFIYKGKYQDCSVFNTLSL